MLHLCYESVTSVLRACDVCVTIVLQVCYECITSVLQLWYECARGVLQVCYKCATRHDQASQSKKTMEIQTVVSLKCKVILKEGCWELYL